MPQSKAVHKEYVRKRRQGSQDITKGSQDLVVSVEKAAKLLLICHSLDKTIKGLTGSENMLDLVRYGVSGPTMREVRARLC